MCQLGIYRFVALWLAGLNVRLCMNLPVRAVRLGLSGSESLARPRAVRLRAADDPLLSGGARSAQGQLVPGCRGRRRPVLGSAAPVYRELRAEPGD